MRQGGMMVLALAIGLAAEANVAEAVAPTASAGASTRPASAPSTPAVQVRRPATGGTLPSGWLIATAAFGLLGLGIRPRSLAGPPTIG